MFLILRVIISVLRAFMMFFLLNKKYCLNDKHEGLQHFYTKARYPMWAFFKSSSTSRAFKPLTSTIWGRHVGRLLDHLGLLFQAPLPEGAIRQERLGLPSRSPNSKDVR